jgi:hypothetical protein
MSGSFVSRFRVLVLLLAFGLGMAGQVASAAVMAMQMQPATSAGIASEHHCSAYPGDQDGGLMAYCSAVGCWTAPALPVRSVTGAALRHITFSLGREVVLVGIVNPPDPHPPRLIFHA